MIRTGILTIGDEILIGQINNTNTKHLAELVSSCGCKVVAMFTVGDNEESILEALKSLTTKCKLIIITGGLGPTIDDITKRVLCNFTGDTLVLNDGWLKHLEEKIEKFGRPRSEVIRSQAMIPSRAKLLFNRIGTAPGMLTEYRGTSIISLPGVPAEMLSIMRDHGMEEISNLAKKCGGESIIYRNISTAGIAESLLAKLLDEITPEYLGQSSLAYLPNFSGVKLRIGAYGESYYEAITEMNRISSKIVSLAETYIISYDEKPFAETLGDILKEKGKTLSIAESCTGGMLGKEIVSIAGASEYFKGGIISYSDEVKIKYLNIPANTINTYGAVSSQTAEAMALNTKQIFNTDYALSITGIAGPTGGTAQKSVGTVWFGLADEHGVSSFMKLCGAQRNAIRERAVQTSIVSLIKKLRGQK